MTFAEIDAAGKLPDPVVCVHPEACFGLSRDGIVVTLPSGRQLQCDPEVLPILLAAQEPVALSALGLPAGAAERLLSTGLLVQPTLMPISGLTAAEAGCLWEYHSGGRRARPKQLLTARLDDGPVALTLPRADPLVMPLGEALARRRSERAFSEAVVSQRTLATLLGSAMSTTYVEHDSGARWRPSPSAGARHPLLTYLGAVRVEGVGRRIYRYEPETRQLFDLPEPNSWRVELSSELEAATAGLLRGEPAAILGFVADVPQLARYYSGSVVGLLFADLGALWQTLYLCCAALSLSCCAISGVSAFGGALPTQGLSRVALGSFILGQSS